MVRPQVFSDEIIPLDVAKHIIARALFEFDPQLGRRAADILHSDRLNVVETMSPQTSTGEPRDPIMQCRPVGMTQDYLVFHKMHMPDFADRYGPHFTEQENVSGSHAIIDYEYTFTKDSVLYLVHELGHAIADDMQREKGKKFSDFHLNELERQAYFIQSIVSQKIAPEFNTESVSFRADGTINLTGAYNRNSQRAVAVTDFEQAQALSTKERNAFIADVLGGSSPSDGEKISAASPQLHFRKS